MTYEKTTLLQPASHQPGDDRARPGARAGEATAGAGSLEFQRLKTLVGPWKATTDLGRGPTQITLEYRLVAGGSALEERLFAGTPNEMVTMYHDHKGRLMLTHNSMLGNHPRMVMKSADERSIQFGFDKGCGINPKTERHMHSLTVTFIDGDTFRQARRPTTGASQPTSPPRSPSPGSNPDRLRAAAGSPAG